MTYHATPDLTAYCPGCNHATCRCRADEADREAHYEASYAAGHADCLADGYDGRPGAETVYRTGARTTWDAAASRWRHAMVPVRFAAFTWRAHHRTAGAYAGWFGRAYGHDLRAYLAGYDDAGAGLPSAVDDPGGHAACAAALDAYESPGARESDGVRAPSGEAA